MKKILLTLSLFVLLANSSFSQTLYSETASPINGVDYSSTVNGICVLCGVVNAAYAADNSLNNYGTMVIPAAVGGSLSFMLNLSSTTSPGNYTGLLVNRWSGLIDVSILSTITIKTYLNGTLKDTKTGAGIQTTDMGGGLQSLSFLSSNSFNQIEMTIGGLVSVANTMDVYYAYGSASVPLPVILSEFNATQNNQVIVLEWKTTTENNNAKFELQRSSDGNNFETLSTINNTQNTTGSTYTVTDENPLNGNNYYRLKQTDNDNKFTYSDILVVENKNASDKINVYVSSDGLIINNNSDKEESYMIQVMDLTGTAVMSTELVLASGSNSALSDLSGKTGIFLVKTKNMNTSESTQVHKIQF